MKLKLRLFYTLLLVKEVQLDQVIFYFIRNCKTNKLLGIFFFFFFLAAAPPGHGRLYGCYVFLINPALLPAHCTGVSLLQPSPRYSSAWVAKPPGIPINRRLPHMEPTELKNVTRKAGWEFWQICFLIFFFLIPEKRKLNSKRGLGLLHQGKKREKNSFCSPPEKKLA